MTFDLSFSAYEGWDNPFRPEGEISHEADELLRMWKEGKLTLKQNDEAGSGADHEQPNSLDCEVKTPLISQTDKSINGNRCIHTQHTDLVLFLLSQCSVTCFSFLLSWVCHIC